MSRNNFLSKWRKLAPPVLKRTMLAAAVLSVAASSATAGDHRRLGDKPYRGWSSWGQQTVNGHGSQTDYMREANIRAQSDALKASGLQKFGYNYFNIDGGWHDNEKANFDAYGRPIASTSAFSDFPGVIKHIHKNGQKAGLYTVPGLSTGAYDANYPILGTPYRVRDIIVGTDSGGNAGIGFGWWSYKIDYKKPGAQEYIDSIVKLWASWGVDFIKLDFVGRSSENDTVVDNRDDVEAWSKAIKKSGRDIWLELSVAVSKEGVSTWQKYANGRRIDQDVECNCKTIGEWTRVLTRFYDLVEWQDAAGPGKGWNDLDGLPVGHALMDGLTLEEQKTTATLWAMANSPYYVSGDLTKLDEASKKLLTNEEVLAVQSSGRPARQIIGGNTPVWASPKLADGSYYVALFNLNAFPAPVTIPWNLIGFDNANQVRDLWSQRNLGRFSGKFTDVIAGHGARLLKVTGKGNVQPARTTKYEAETAQLSGTAAAVACSACSSGKKVVSINNGANNAVTFNKVIAPRAGTYLMAVDYLTVQVRSFQFSVNGGPLNTLSVGGTTLNLPSRTTVPVELKAGQNIIRFSNAAVIVSPELDSIAISGDGSLPRPFGTTYEAENATFGGVAKAAVRPSVDIRTQNYWQWRYLSNSAAAGPVGGAGNTVTFNNVSVASAGTYQVEIAYAAFPYRPVQMSVNGGARKELELRGNNKEDTAARTVVQVKLKAGTNTIQFSNPAGDASNGAYLDNIVVAPVVGNDGAACLASSSLPYWAYGLGLCEWTYTGSWEERANSLVEAAPRGPFTGYFHSASAGSTATISFTNASEVSLNAIVNNKSGRIMVSLNGGHPTLVDLYDKKSQLKEVFSSKRLDPAKTHKLTVTVVGSKNSASSSAEVSLAEIKLGGKAHSH